MRPHSPGWRPGSRPGGSCGPRCRRRDRPPPMFIRQDASPAVHRSAPVPTTLRTLSASIADEVSAFLMENVPPKPQHSSAPGSSTRSMPCDLPQQPDGLVADPQHPQRVAGRVVGDPVRVVGADVGHAEHIHQQFGQLVGAAGQGGGPLRQGGVADPAGDHRLLMPDRADARPGRGDGHVERRGLEHLDVVPDHRHRLLEVAGVHVHLPAADLVGREDHLVAEAFQQQGGGLGHLGEQRVTQTGGDQCDTHGISGQLILRRRVRVVVFPGRPDQAGRPFRLGRRT